MLQSARHFKAVALIAALGSASVIAACNDDDDDLTNPTKEEFVANLAGANERPNPVTTTATGSAGLDFTGSGPISFTITVASLSGPATGAHIHGPADATQTADPIATFSGLASSLNGQLASGTITATDSPGTISLDSLKKLIRNGKAYINVHTALNPPGEIRGQIVAKP